MFYSRLIILACAAFLAFLASPVYANYIEVTLLGTGTPRPSLERFGPSTLVQAKGRFFLFDSGRGTTIRLAQAGVPLSQIEHIYLTHLHSDHISGLSDLSLTSWIWQRPTPLKLTGPTGTKNLAKHLNQAYAADFDYRTKNTGLDPKTFDIDGRNISAEDIIYKQDGITITAFLVDHHPVEPAYGYRLDYGDASVVISGDTTYSTNLIKHAKNVDLLIHEIAAANTQLLARNPRLNKVLSYHTTPEQAGRLLEIIQPKAAVYNHVLLFGIDEETILETTRSFFQGNLRVGKDLMKIGVGETSTFY